MKIYIILLLIFNADATETFDIVKIRKLFSEALTNEQKANELISYSDKINYTPIASGYKGAGNMLLSKFSFNLYKKYKYFNEGKGLLEASIQKDASSVELRYLRFAFQTHVPSFLGYNNSIEEDKHFLIDTVRNITDNNLRNSIINLLKKSNYVDEHDKQKL